VEQLVLTVTRSNQAAAKLYKGAGFVTFGLEPRAIKVDGEYFDKEHMFLFL
jgi:ribosomal protein S18 acetylase RimI-like enzyme